MIISSLQSLRNHAISNTLFNRTSLPSAIERLKFVQADPIRSPARAQDLILRQRVENYHAGDLERHYPSLDLEEDILYAYGFMTRDVWHLLYPRMARELPQLEQKILATINKFGEIHPKQLEAQFTRERVMNAWGGYSKATKSALENLHYQGLLRVTRREKGIRVYGAVPSSSGSQISLTERLRKLALVISRIFAPVAQRCLQEILSSLRRSFPLSPLSTKTVIDDLIKSGELQSQSIDGINYLYPHGNSISDVVPRQVRFLAPFDPLVWDRRRFEHFWGWAYRFEAYTPPAKRVRGYYAMPMLWNDIIIGWANVTAQRGVLDVEIGFAGNKPTDSDFRSELEKEIGRLETFLNPKNKI